MQLWRVAAADLGFSVESPFNVKVSEGPMIQVDVLVCGFGGVKGTLLLSSEQLTQNISRELISLGYGYSVLDEIRAMDEYKRDDFIEILSEWGWAGAEDNCPSWIVSSDPYGFIDK